MVGRRPSLRSPWFGDGKTFMATGLSGGKRSDMPHPATGHRKKDQRRVTASPQTAFGGDRLPGCVDGREALGRDLHGFRRQSAGDLPVGVVLDHQSAVMALQVVV